MEMENPRSLSAALTAACAALYFLVGYLTYFGVVVLGVRFWPAVIVPGAFAVLFGPWIGGVGAAIGIFISDMLMHGMPLLSLSVGVPANFLGFYIIGYFTRSYSLKRYCLAATTGLLVGSAIIGVGVWTWSQAFILPGGTTVSPLPIVSAFSIFLWTFVSEIPFLIFVVPPIVEVLRKTLILPRLK